MIKNLLLLLLFAILLIGCSTAENIKKSSTFSSEIEAEIKTIENLSKYGTLLERMEAWDVPGMSIAVVLGGEIRWAKGYGTANTIYGTKVEVDTLFQAGSISKSISALGALKLVEEGYIDLDEDINPYLKTWKIPYSDFTQDEKVTLRRLLSHTAGFGGPEGLGFKQGETIPSIVDELNGLGKNGKLAFIHVPGEKFEYSNGGYTITEKLIEDITGLSFKSYMEESILRPLGMNDSTFEQPLPDELHARASAGYDNTGKITEGLWHNTAEQATMGLWTTSTDLARFCIGIYEILSGKTDGILSKKTIEQMFIKDKKYFNDKEYYGLGFVLLEDEEGDGTLYGHQGSTSSGFNNMYFSYVNSGDALIVFANSFKGFGLMDEIGSIFGEYYGWEELQ